MHTYKILVYDKSFLNIDKSGNPIKFQNHSNLFLLFSRNNAEKGCRGEAAGSVRLMPFVPAGKCQVFD